MYTIAPTHYFTFNPTGDFIELLEFAKKNKSLNKPEDIGFGIIPAFIAGLEKEDDIRMTFYSSPKVVAGQIFSFIPNEGEKELSPQLEKRNKAAIEKVEKLLASFCEAGFVNTPPNIVQGFWALERNLPPYNRKFHNASAF